MHARNLSAREPGDLQAARCDGAPGRVGKASRSKPTMNGMQKSDGPVVPTKLPNGTTDVAKEAMEGRGPAKGNTKEQNATRAQNRTIAQSALDRVRQAARFDANTRGRSRVR
jgi:hypothetical protein